MGLAADPLAIKLLAFTLCSLPIMLTSLKSGMIRNRHVFVFACVGLAMRVYEHRSHFTVGDFLHVLTVTIVVVIVAAVLFHTRSLDAGMGKFITATVPWFSTWDFVTVVAVSGILAVPQIVAQRLIGRRSGVQFAPYVIVAGCFVIGSALL